MIRRNWLRPLTWIGALIFAAPALASEATEIWSVHGQVTFVWQYHPAFTSPYAGAHSLDPGSRGNETVDATLYLGLRPWSGAELWINPEIDQGFGLSDTLGVAGFPSGEAYKVGKNAPYFRVPRAFFRQVIDLDGEPEPVAPGPNEVGGTRSPDNLIFTAGKVSDGDVFG